MPETETLSDYLFVQLIADGQSVQDNLHENDHYLLLQIHLVTLEAHKQFRLKRAKLWRFYQVQVNKGVILVQHTFKNFYAKY